MKLLFRRLNSSVAFAAGTAIRIVASATMLGLFLAAAAQAQTPEKLLLNREVQIDPQFHANIWSAVHVLADQGIPIGFEARSNWNVDVGPRLKLKSGTLSSVLQAICQQDSSYAWQEVDGVINFFPVADRNKKTISFFNTRIGPITIRKGDDRASTVEKIRMLFEGAGVGEARFVSQIGFGNPLGLDDNFENEVSIPISDMKTVLNMFIKEQGYRPIWSVIQYPDREEITVVF